LDPSAHRPAPAKLVSSPFNPGGKSRGIRMRAYCGKGMGMEKQAFQTSQGEVWLWGSAEGSGLL
jgi:hypothetical protein